MCVEGGGIITGPRDIDLLARLDFEVRLSTLDDDERGIVQHGYDVGRVVDMLPGAHHLVHERIFHLQKHDRII